MRYVIIGNSAAGLTGAQAIRRYDRRGEITVISQEGAFPYCRCLTSYLLAGSITERDMIFCATDVYEKLDLEMVTAQVVGVDYELKQVQLTGEREIAYDKLLIASGANPIKPDIPGIGGPGAYPLRTLRQTREMLSLLPGVEQVVVSGGGLVSLKSAAAFAKQGKKVTVIVSSRQVMSQVLDERAAQLCQKALEKIGIAFYLEDEIVMINRGRIGNIKGVFLKSGTELPCQLILYGKGVAPNTWFLGELAKGLKTGAGLKVNPRLETGKPGVFAAGDVVETYDLAWGDYRINALWPNAREQGTTAGANMAGQQVEYQGSMGANAVDFPGFRLIAAGITRREPSDCSSHIREWGGREAGYEKLVFRGNKLVGYILIGKENTLKAGILTNLIKSGKPALELLEMSGRKDILPSLVR